MNNKRNRKPFFSGWILFLFSIILGLILIVLIVKGVNGFNSSQVSYKTLFDSFHVWGIDKKTNSNIMASLNLMVIIPIMAFLLIISMFIKGIHRKRTHNIEVGFGQNPVSRV